MRLSKSLEIFNYWDQLRGPRDAPMRTEIQPSSVRHILPELFILEATPGGPLRFRLAGTAVCSLFGRELRGEHFTALWAGGQPGDAARVAEGVMGLVVPALIDAIGYSVSGRDMAFEMILMPLRSAEDACDRLLGCLTPAVNAPWLGAEPLEHLVLSRSRPHAPRAGAIDGKRHAALTGSSETGARKPSGGIMRRMLTMSLFQGGAAR